MQWMNCNRYSLVPRGTPKPTVSHDDELPLSVTNCFRSNKYDLYHSSVQFLQFHSSQVYLVEYYGLWYRMPYEGPGKRIISCQLQIFSILYLCINCGMFFTESILLTIKHIKSSEVVLYQLKHCPLKKNFLLYMLKRDIGR